MRLKKLWKDIPDFEGMYQISNYGEVRSLRRKKIKIISTSYKSNAIPFINLWYLGKKQCCAIDKLVATLFIPNPKKFIHIKHKDGNLSNNRVDNLEWTNVHHLAKPTLQFTLKGKLVRKFPSAREILRKTGHFISINGVYKIMQGYYWIPEKVYNEKLDIETNIINHKCNYLIRILNKELSLKKEIRKRKRKK